MFIPKYYCYKDVALTIFKESRVINIYRIFKNNSSILKITIHCFSIEIITFMQNSRTQELYLLWSKYGKMIYFSTYKILDPIEVKINIIKFLKKNLH